jgi:type IV pilus assembly protein PilO
MGNIDFRDPDVQIAGMIIFVALAIAYMFFLTPLVPFGYRARAQEISELRAEYETLSADVMKAKQTASRLPQVQEEYDALAGEWEEAKNLLPTQKEMAQLLSQVTVAGQRAGVEFLLFEPKPATPRDIYLENPIEVGVQGGYHEIGKFLGRLSNLPRIINVGAVDMKSVTNPADNALPDFVEASMTLTAYTLLSEEDRARNATPKPKAPAKPKGGRRGGH